MSAIAAAALLAAPLTASAQLKVIISGGFSGPYEKLLPEFERTVGVKVTTGSGSSQGTGPETIGAQLARGVPADVVILSREGLTELIAAKRILAGTDVDLARTPLGIAVRAGAPKPDVTTVDAFKRLVLNARLVAMPSSTSGIFLTDTVFPKLGIAGKVNVKATPRGTGATAMVASGEADVAIMPVSEIVHAPGVEMAGVLAEEIQLHQIFAAAVVSSSTGVAAAKKLIAFLASDAARPAIRNSGMEPLALVLSAPAALAQVTPNGFAVKHEVTIAAPPDKVYDVLTKQVGSWWSPDHTYSHDGRNLSIDARPGGCFCEKLPNGGGVEHLRVIFAAPGELLRLSGALGPLQASGLAGTMSWDLAKTGSGTTLRLTYVAGGYMEGGFEQMAPAVRAVLLEQLTRLKSFIESGKPS